MYIIVPVILMSMDSFEDGLFPLNINVVCYLDCVVHKTTFQSLIFSISTKR